ncbi:DNA/RNA non-specific endonuclease [Hymenobacter sublimis]|uniref:DNA/RNA non-specific endonuclease n=1 Tax=Hymenobacter sublimis TaxID=2933777 RepID=A0ABY4JA18_9BACT|nr:DNA/RNA non-specific endonuclease [Hymenobacter sublimis]UPL49660.1 DNA/RNA non-specific endonuclease [Hymenobacter sublimis]
MAYPAGTVSLTSGDWILTDAVLGSAEADRKNGAQAVRLQQNGTLSMAFFLPNGANTVTVQHAIYGTDASSSWELWAQSEACNCNKWTKVGNTVFTTTATLQTAAFTVNIPGKVKFEIRKTSGGAARLNLDDFAVTDYGVAQPSLDNDHLALGNPSGATADPSYPNNYLLLKPQFAVGYNRDQGKPNWVSWHLDISDRGSSDRQDDFRNDTSLPQGWYQVQSTSYSGSGFDRGHNCPSADRTSSDENNSATFLMTNMMPQAPQNNQGPWATLEGYARTFLPNNEVYIVCGSYGVGGTGSNGGLTTTLDQGRLTVPNRTWKVIVVLPVGDNDVARITAATRVIAVDMPNINTLNQDWSTYRTTVDAIEAATGYDLLSKLPIEVQTAIESKVDAGPVL